MWSCRIYVISHSLSHKIDLFIAFFKTPYDIRAFDFIASNITIVDCCCCYCRLNECYMQDLLSAIKETRFFLMNIAIARVEREMESVKKLSCS